jgi:hypothetical protein
MTGVLQDVSLCVSMKSSRGENVLIRDAIEIFEMIATGLLDSETDGARNAALDWLPLVLRLDGVLGPALTPRTNSMASSSKLS